MKPVATPIRTPRALVKAALAGRLPPGFRLFVLDCTRFVVASADGISPTDENGFVTGGAIRFPLTERRLLRELCRALKIPFGRDPTHRWRPGPPLTQDQAAAVLGRKPKPKRSSPSSSDTL